MKRIALCMVAWLAAPALAEPNAPEFSFRAPIVAPPGHSHYRAAQPAAVYAGLEQAGFGDLRVLNASGESVPHAFLPRSPSEPAPVQTDAARIFPLYGETGIGVEGVKLDVVRSASGTVIRLADNTKNRPKAQRKLLGYLVDAGESELPLEALRLDWRTSAGFNGAARVEGSDDLLHWRTLVADRPVLALEHAGERLERKHVELSGRKAKYLRLSFTHVPQDFVVQAVYVERRRERDEPGREWRRLAGTPVAGKPGEYRFDAGGRFPVDRVRLHMPQENTVARLQLLTRDDDHQPWRSRAQASAFRLDRDGAMATNPDIAVPPVADRQWLIRVDQRGGGLGAGELVLETGWVPHELVFAARGAAPFTLAYGSRRAKSEALHAAAVVPGYGPGKELVAQLAEIGAPAGSSRPAASLADPMGLLRELMASGEGKKWLLWVILSLGALGVAWMALRLLRDVGRGGTPPGGAQGE
jgi:hypothetical protein